MSKSTASIKDVAARAGVSTATVRKAANELGYHVNRAAPMLRSGRNKIVAVVVADLADPHFTSVIREIERLAKRDGFEVIVRILTMMQATNARVWRRLYHGNQPD